MKGFGEEDREDERQKGSRICILQGRLEEAEKALPTSLGIYEKMGGSASDWLLTDLEALASLYEKMGDESRAESFRRRAADIESNSERRQNLRK